jgi:hypothetical protein
MSIRSVVGERSMGRVREEDEQSRPAAFFSATERRFNVVMGRCHRSAHLVQARGSSEEGAIGRLLPCQSG